MARNSTAVKALEKALEQFKAQAGNPASAAKASTKASASGEDKSTEYLIKVSRRFADGLITFYEEEKNRVQGFLDTVNAIESGNYAPRRGGGRKGAGRRKNPTHKEAMEAGDINDKK
jgi:hypothetical protein